jgi:hypothetical protein
MFVTYKKYKMLKDAYDYLLKDRKKQLSEMEALLKTMCDNYCEALKEANKYKELYADELQKRLNLSETVRTYEENNGD